jgi:hypothetical protein
MDQESSVFVQQTEKFVAVEVLVAVTSIARLIDSVQARARVETHATPLDSVVNRRRHHGNYRSKVHGSVGASRKWCVSQRGMLSSASLFSISFL